MAQGLTVLTLHASDDECRELGQALYAVAGTLLTVGTLDEALVHAATDSIDALVLVVPPYMSQELLVNELSRLREGCSQPLLVLLPARGERTLVAALRARTLEELGIADVLWAGGVESDGWLSAIERAIARERQRPSSAAVERRAEASYLLAARLARACTPDEVSGVLVDGLLALGASACALFLRDDDDLVLTHARGVGPAWTRSFARLAIDAPEHPLCEAARSCAPVWNEHASDADPQAGSAEPARQQVRAALPLLAGGRVLGVLGLDFAGQLSCTEQLRRSLERAVETAAHALERAHRFARLEERMVEGQRLLGIASHDLRSPLHLISMASDLLEGQVTTLSAAERRTLEQIGESARRAADLVTQLLDLTKLELKPVAVRPAPEDVFALLARCVEDFRLRLPDCPIATSFRGSGQALLDRDRVVQIAHNLLANAAQYREPGSVVEVRGEGLRDRIYLEVNNRGPVIEPAILSELFAPMTRGRGEGEQGSVGLGLFIVRRLVTAHGGRVWARSSEQEGTTFMVELPRETPLEQTVLATASARRADCELDGEEVPESYAPLLRALHDSSHVALLRFWLALGGATRLPHPRQFERAQSFALLPDMFRVAVASNGLGQPRSFRFEEVGAALERRLHGSALGGGTVRRLDDPLRIGLYAAYERCVTSRRPVFDYLRAGPSKSASSSFERLILPCSRTGDEVTHLVGFASYHDLPETSGIELEPTLVQARERERGASRESARKAP